MYAHAHADVKLCICTVLYCTYGVPYRYYDMEIVCLIYLSIYVSMEDFSNL